ncbi:hypothetical protein EDB81DRAFT_892238 [Dactylonectria macrodidyma]|uniref:Uncharacterized protein n=1 Tax=Dactylonectria macrodidyma TaxID=307937 RepID=A0A9P9DEB2_9HYPO|nr:hypothetical protein EDB81DRAFT_892238 [Dactylonectria macrodidyma]
MSNAVVGLVQLMATVPASRALANLMALWISAVKTDAYSPNSLSLALFQHFALAAKSVDVHHGSNDLLLHHLRIFLCLDEDGRRHKEPLPVLRHELAAARPLS